jgi:hypothetical protein
LRDDTSMFLDTSVTDSFFILVPYVARHAQCILYNKT